MIQKPGQLLLHHNNHLLFFESLQPRNFFILLLPAAAGIVSVLQSSSSLLKSNLFITEKKLLEIFIHSKCVTCVHLCSNAYFNFQCCTASSFDTFRSLSILFSSLMSMSIRSRSSMIREASASGLSSSSNAWLAAMLKPL